MALFNLGKKKEEKKVATCCCGSVNNKAEENSGCCGSSSNADETSSSCCSESSIKVLGSGCKNCHDLFEVSKAAVKNPLILLLYGNGRYSSFNSNHNGTRNLVCPYISNV